jgi:hypothetical protein
MLTIFPLFSDGVPGELDELSSEFFVQEDVTDKEVAHNQQHHTARDDRYYLKIEFDHRRNGRTHRTVNRLRTNDLAAYRGDDERPQVRMFLVVQRVDGARRDDHQDAKRDNRQHCRTGSEYLEDVADDEQGQKQLDSRLKVRNLSLQLSNELNEALTVTWQQPQQHWYLGSFSLKSSDSCMSQLFQTKFETEDDRVNKLARAQHKQKTTTLRKQQSSGPTFSYKHIGKFTCLNLIYSNFYEQ